MNRRSFPLLVLATAIIAAIFLAYSNHFNNSFHFDDSHSIVANSYIHSLDNVPLFFTMPEIRSTLPTNRAYRPMLMVTFAVDYWLAGGLNPFFFHASTFFWFLVQAVGMFFFYLKMMDRSRKHSWTPYVALLTVGWYCLHTANAETINYISARSDSLSTLCVLLAFLIHINTATWRRNLSLVPLSIGMLIKPTVVMYVPLVVVYELLFVEQLSLAEIFEKRNRSAVGRVFRGAAPVAVVSVALFAWTMKMTPESWTPGGVSNWNYLITQPFVIARYLWLVFVPTTLSADSDWQALTSLWDWRFLLGVLLLAALGVVSFIASKTRTLRPIAFGILWFLLALVPSSSVIALAEVTNDHRLFFPYVGLCLAVGWALALVLMKYEDSIAHSLRLRLVVWGAIMIVLGTYGYGTYQRNKVWDSNETLWLDVVQKSPRNGRGMMNYGLALMNRGSYEAALGYFEKARGTSYGRHPYIPVNTAIAMSALRRPNEEVEAYFRIAIRMGPNYPDCHYFFARWLAEQGRSSEALIYLRKALELSPGHFEAVRLRERLMQTSLFAVAHAVSRAQESPTSGSFLQLSLEYYRVGRYSDCIQSSLRALELDPGYVPAYNNICAAYNAQHMWDKALDACDQALRLDPDHELARNNRAWTIVEKAKAKTLQIE